LRETLKSINDQSLKPDAIYLTLPKIAKRSGEAYPPLPDDMKELCTIVEIDVDYGPICKIYGGLYTENDQNTIVITIDDDTIYKHTFVEKMVEKCNLMPRVAVCGTGARLIRGPAMISIISSLDFVRPWCGILGFPADPVFGGLVDVGYGVGGVAYRRWMFPSKAKLYEDFVSLGQDKYNLFRQDDVMISGYLSREGIEIRVFTDIPTVSTAIGMEDCITPNMDTMIKGLTGAIEEGKELGFFPTMQPVPISNTIVGNVGLGVWYFLMLIATCIAVYWFI
jgi:hypothetical protein